MHEHILQHYTDADLCVGWGRMLSGSQANEEEKGAMESAGGPSPRLSVSGQAASKQSICAKTAKGEKNLKPTNESNHSHALPLPLPQCVVPNTP